MDDFLCEIQADEYYQSDWDTEYWNNSEVE